LRNGATVGEPLCSSQYERANIGDIIISAIEGRSSERF